MREITKEQLYLAPDKIGYLKELFGWRLSEVEKLYLIGFNLPFTKTGYAKMCDISDDGRRDRIRFNVNNDTYMFDDHLIK